ncbi:MAG TPA: CdaR family protein [Bryobacteraceae bacterium]|nr:CdaR family protein [Bryobacteraceae bacterium]
MRFLTHNIFWKLLSLVAAFAIWLNIASEPELATILSAPVEYKNYPKDLEISSDIVEAINVETRGPSGEIRALSQAHLAAVVDFSSVTAPGERTFTITARELGLPSDVALIRTIPEQLRFNFERRATRTLQVEAQFSGTLPHGLTMTGYDIEPPGLTIAGPETRVAAVRKAVADPFDLSQVTGDTQQKLSVYIQEPEVRFVSVPQVTVKIHVEHTH